MLGRQDRGYACICRCYSPQDLEALCRRPPSSILGTCGVSDRSLDHLSSWPYPQDYTITLPAKEETPPHIRKVSAAPSLPLARILEVRCSFARKAHGKISKEHHMAEVWPYRGDREEQQHHFHEAQKHRIRFMICGLRSSRIAPVPVDSVVKWHQHRTGSAKSSRGIRNMTALSVSPVIDPPMPQMILSRHPR